MSIIIHHQADIHAQPFGIHALSDRCCIGCEGFSSFTQLRPYAHVCAMDFIDSNERFIVSVLKSNASSFERKLLKEEREDVRQSHAMLSAIYSRAIVSCGV